MCKFSKDFIKIHDLLFIFLFSLRHKLTSTLRPYDLINHLKHNDEQIQIYAYANLVLSTITNFTLSSATVMGLIHVPTQDFNRKSISFPHQNVSIFKVYLIFLLLIYT